MEMEIAEKEGVDIESLKESIKLVGDPDIKVRLQKLKEEVNKEEEVWLNVEFEEGEEAKNDW